MYNFDFLAGVYNQDQLMMNHYSVHLNLLTQTMDAASTNVALERVKCFVQRDMQHTVFFGVGDHDKAEMFHVMGTNVTTLPEEPVDQIIGIMLYCKLNAIMEDRMVVTSLDVSSTLGESVWYSHDDDDNLGPFADDSDKSWWYTTSPQHHCIELESNADNVVKVIPNVWHEYGLKWPEEEIDNSEDNTVIYPNFQRNETK